MTRLFVDTNVVLDLLLRRHPHWAAASEIFTLAERGEVALFASALTFANGHYIIQKELGSAEAIRKLLGVTTLLSIVDLTAVSIQRTLSGTAFQDFEDGLQHAAALEINAEALITRNEKDFAPATIPVLSPRAYLAER